MLSQRARKTTQKGEVVLLKKKIEANIEVVAGAIGAKTDKTRTCPDVSGFISN